MHGSVGEARDAGSLAGGARARRREVSGDLGEDDDRETTDRFAQVWVHGRASVRLALTVTPDSENLASEVAFTLPGGTSPEHAVVVLDGREYPINVAQMERY